MQGLAIAALLPLIATTASADYGSGIPFKHPEGSYEFNLRFRTQNLVEIDSPDQGDTEVLAQVRRLRLRLQGWALDPALAFQIQLSFSRSDMDWSNTRFPNVVRDAMITYSPIPSQLSFSFGQGKLPGNRQRVISSGELQFADRSIVNRVFNFDRDFGFQALYRSEAFALKGAISTGEGRNLTTSSNLGLGYVGRAEWLPLGPFKSGNDMQEGDLAHEARPRLALAYSLASFRASNRAGGTIGPVFVDAAGDPIRRDQLVHYADLIFKWQGFSLYSEFAFRTSDEGAIDADTALFEGRGILLQSGWFFDDHWELAARHARNSPLARATIDPANQDTAQTTLGLSRYLAGHRVKVQADLTRQSLFEPSWIGRFNFELGI